MFHNVSSSADQNVDGNGRLLLQAVTGLWEAQTFCERSQCGSLGEYGAATSVFY